MTPAARERAQVRSPILLLCTAAWFVLGVEPGSMALHAHHGGAMPGMGAASVQMMLAHNPLGSLGLGWALMLVAMMAPLLIGPIQHIRDRSFASRRALSISLFVAGYAAIWMLVGAMMLTLAFVVRTIAGDSILPVTLALVVAVVWQFSPLKQLCLNWGHVHLALAAFGRAADLDAIRFGLVHGFWCVGSCWALMLLPVLVAEGHLLAMAAVTVFLIAERFERPMPLRWSLRVPNKTLRIAIAQTHGWLSTALRK